MRRSRRFRDTQDSSIVVPVTLLINAVAKNHALHASDRLTTYTERRKVKEWDVRANKTIVVVGSDSWIVLAYTGIAYLDGKPTDQFIAEAITEITHLDKGALISRASLQRLHLNEICRRVAENVQQAFNRLPLNAQKHKLFIIGSGLQFTKPRWRHLVLGFEFNRSGFEVGCEPNRYMPWNSNQVLPGGVVIPEIMADARIQLRNRGWQSPDVFRSILVDAVRKTGLASDMVGKDVVSVVLAPEDRTIHVHFDLWRGSDPIQGPSASAEYSLPPVQLYTPYIILPGVIFCPAASTAGGWHSDGISVKLHGNPSSVGGGYFGGYDRKPALG